MRRGLAILISFVTVLSLSGCNPEEQITATTKDIPVYNEEAETLSGNEQNVSRPDKEDAPDMSEYIRKSDVEELYVRKDEVQSMIDRAVEEALDRADGKEHPAQKGPKGDPGRGIAAVAISEEGNLCIAYTDGTFADLGRVKGDKGDKGDRGEQGEKGDSGRVGNDKPAQESPEKQSHNERSKEEAEAKAAADAAKAAEEAAKAAAEAAAPTVSVGGHEYGGHVFTNDEWNCLLSVWDYTGDAAEMISHHSAAELKAVLDEKMAGGARSAW